MALSEAGKADYLVTGDKSGRLALGPAKRHADSVDLIPLTGNKSLTRPGFLAAQFFNVAKIPPKIQLSVTYSTVYR